MVEISNRIVLGFEKGSFAFKNIGPDATDTDRFAIATLLNELQEDAVKRVLKVQVFEIE